MQLDLVHKEVSEPKKRQLNWPEVYQIMFTPMILVTLIAIAADGWVEYSEAGITSYFYKDIINFIVVGIAAILFKTDNLTKSQVINITVYSIVLGLMVMMPYRITTPGFHFETYFLKVEIVLIILTYAIGILVHPRHILYLLLMNLIFIATCAIYVDSHYPISKYVFYIMLMTGTSLLGYKLNRIFMGLNDQIFHANELIKSQNEDLQRANEAKDQLFEILGHDLKAPFFHLSALLTLHDNATTPEKKEEYSRLMKNAIIEGDQLVVSLLNWADVQSTYLKFELEDHSVTDVVQKAIDYKKENCMLKDITIEEELQNDLEIKMDVRMMETVMRNLICNAIKFSDRKSTIKVSSAQENEIVKITVQDHGIGMSQDLINELFEVGKISPRLGTESEPGSGFGLNICKKMVQNQGGEMVIESEENVGTTVTLYFKPSNVG